MTRTERTVFTLLALLGICALGYSFYVAAVADHAFTAVHATLR